MSVPGLSGMPWGKFQRSTPGAHVGPHRRVPGSSHTGDEQRRRQARDCARTRATRRTLMRSWAGKQGIAGPADRPTKATRPLRKP
jgi:hypothetical protein